MGRDAWGLRLVDQLRGDTRYAARRLVRDWRFSLLAVMILALGIGANTAMFSVVSSLYSTPTVFRDTHQLVNIYQNDPDSGLPGFLSTSYPAYEDMAAYTDLYTGVMATSVPQPVRIYQDERVRRGMAEFATSTYLAVVGLDPSMGRWFTAAEDRLGAEALEAAHDPVAQRRGGDRGEIPERHGVAAVDQRLHLGAADQ